MCRVDRRFIEFYAQLACPLMELLKKDAEFVWTAILQTIFETLNVKLVAAPSFHLLDGIRPFMLHDASGWCLGVIFVAGRK
jgi:hypothetical protein